MNQLIIDGDHGRIETSMYWITSEINHLLVKENWKGLQSIGRLERTREVCGKISIDKYYYITSLESDVELFVTAVRDHWRIGNGLER